jgi:hypothetical protein
MSSINPDYFLNEWKKIDCLEKELSAVKSDINMETAYPKKIEKYKYLLKKCDEAMDKLKNNLDFREQIDIIQ